jgi:hypothetical protein
VLKVLLLNCPLPQTDDQKNPFNKIFPRKKSHVGGYRVARFFFVQNTKKCKNRPKTQIITLYWPLNSNKNAICQHFTIQRLPKYPQIWIFGIQINVTSGNPGRKVMQLMPVLCLLPAVVAHTCIKPSDVTKSCRYSKSKWDI